MIEDIIPFAIPIIALLIPIVVILTKHQQKMAELLRGSSQQLHQPSELAELRREISDLKQVVSQQAIAMDDFLSSQAKLRSAPPEVPDEIRNRLGS
jgi:hypothetical protein